MKVQKEPVNLKYTHNSEAGSRRFNAVRILTDHLDFDVIDGGT